MCGRIALINPDKERIKKRFRLKKVPDDLKGGYNIPPSLLIPAILNESLDELSLVKWGLVPHWAKEDNTKYSMINAKAETITEKPAYKGPFKSRRCLIIADTFYEWMRTGSAKRPFRFFIKEEGLFAMAGIWDRWEKNGKRIDSCAIITCGPNSVMAPVHDRMPVILTPEEEQVWLSDADEKTLIKLLKPCRSELLQTYEISTRVNSPANNTADILNK